MSRDAGSFPSGQIFQLGEWRFRADLHQVERDDRQIRLEPRVAQLLLCLIENRGQPVSREQLLESVWPDSVVGDEALSNAVNKLRRALEDNRQDPAIIETLPKIGYRLIAPVVECEGESAGDGEILPVRGSKARDKGLTVTVVALLVIVLAGLLVWHLYRITNDDDSAALPAPSLDRGAIAVLPFENLNRDPEHDYFADGMSDDLITGLSKIPGLMVISRSSSYAYRDQALELAEISAALNARYIVEGSVRRDKDRIRINAQLVDAASGRHMWAERFDGPSERLFDLQDQITRQVVSVLESVLEAPGLVLSRAKPTANLDAYELFLKGSGTFQRFSRVDTEESRKYFEKALELDPNFASALALLAWTYVFEYTNGWSQAPQDTLDTALELARRSIALDKRSSVAHFVKGLVHRERREFELARAEATRALEIEPSYANGYVLMATLLYYDDKPEEGLELLEMASRLNPLYPSNYPFHKGQALFILGRYDQAIAAFRAGLNQNPSSQRLRVWLAAAYAQKGMIDEAAWEADEILNQDPEFSPHDLETIFPFRKSADLERFNQALQKAGFRKMPSSQGN